MAYQSFEELDVWKRSARLSVSIYNAFRDCREYSLRDQVIRSAISIPSNIAEGSDRDSRKEFVRFLNIAKGSAAELRTQLYIVLGVQLLEARLVNELIAELKQISAMLHRLTVSLNTEN